MDGNRASSSSSSSESGAKLVQNTTNFTLYILRGSRMEGKNAMNGAIIILYPFLHTVAYIMHITAGKKRRRRRRRHDINYYCYYLLTSHIQFFCCLCVRSHFPGKSRKIRHPVWDDDDDDHIMLVYEILSSLPSHPFALACNAIRVRVRQHRWMQLRSVVPTDLKCVCVYLLQVFWAGCCCCYCSFFYKEIHLGFDVCEARRKTKGNNKLALSP